MFEFLGVLSSYKTTTIIAAAVVCSLIYWQTTKSAPSNKEERRDDSRRKRRSKYDKYLLNEVGLSKEEVSNMTPKEKQELVHKYKQEEKEAEERLQKEEEEFLKGDNDEEEKRPKPQKRTTTAAEKRFPQQRQQMFSTPRAPPRRSMNQEPRQMQAIIEKAKRAEELRKNNKIDESCAAYEKLIESIVNDRELGQSHPLVGIFTYSLAKMRKDQKHLLEAEALLKTVVENFKINGGATTFEFVDVLLNFSDVCVELQKYAEGEVHLKNALQVLQTLSKKVPPGSEQESENHKGFAIVYDGLCFIAYKQKRYQEAENYGKQAHKYYSKGFGNQPHPLMFRNLMKMSQIYMEQGLVDKVAEVIKTTEKMFGSDPAAVAHFMDFFANLHFDKGLFKEAEALYRKSLALLDKNRSKERKQLHVELLNSLSTCLREQNKIQESDQLFEQLKQELRAHPDLHTPATNSHFFVTLASSVLQRSGEEDDFDDAEEGIPRFSIILKQKHIEEQILPPDAVLVATFENPAGGPPLQTEQRVTLQDLIVAVNSPQLQHVEQHKFYEVNLQLFADSSKAQLLSQHRMLIDTQQNH